MSRRNLRSWLPRLGGALTLLCGLTAPPAARAAERHATVAAEAAALRGALVATRRELHQHPELSNREVETGQRIAARLRALGIPFAAGQARTGVVATIVGGKPGPAVLVRADIDALPIQETLDVPYRSQVAGVKHACGHDLHTTVALGTAELLFRRRQQLAGTAYVLFQPAEEGPPLGEKGGVPLLIAEGILERLKPAAMFALHSLPTLQVGTAGWTPGAEMASTDTFRIVLHGRGSHGAQPHKGLDPIVMAAQLVMALQTIDSRRIDPLQPIVVTVGLLRAGTRFNIIPAEAELHGTLRTLDEGVRKQARGLIASLSTGTAAAYGGTAQVSFEDDAANPVLVNDAKLGPFGAASLARTLGEANVVRIPPLMVGEDFAHFAQRVPSFYFLLGVGNEKRGISAGLHTAEFDLDEDALPLGVAAMTNLVLDWLESAGRRQ